MAALRNFSETYTGIGLERPETRFNLAKKCHDTLESELGPNRRTFFDQGVSVVEGPVWMRLDQANGGAKVRLSSLDFAIYAYIKEELVNTEDSSEVKYLKDKCPFLMRFITLMDFLFKERASRPEDAKNEASTARNKFFDKNQIRFVQPQPQT